MSEYQEFKAVPPEAISKVAELIEALKSGVDIIYNIAKENALLAKALASGGNIYLIALKTSLDAIIEEIEKLKGGTFSGILAHPYVYRIISKYDRITDTMTLTAESALQQIKEAFDDEADNFAPDKFNNYGGLVIVGSAPGIEQFGEILDAIGKFFSKQELLDLKEQILKRWEEKEEPVIIKLSKGLDFFGITQEEIFPEYVDLLNEIQSYVEGIRSGDISASGSLDDTIEFIDKKLEEGEKIVQKISGFLDKFIFELSGAGIYYKIFDSENNTAETIKRELLEGMPKEWKTSNYSIVLGIFGGSESIEFIFRILPLD